MKADLETISKKGMLDCKIFPNLFQKKTGEVEEKTRRGRSSGKGYNSGRATHSSNSHKRTF